MFTVSFSIWRTPHVCENRLLTVLFNIHLRLYRLYRPYMSVFVKTDLNMLIKVQLSQHK